MEICNYMVFGLPKNEEATVYAPEEFSKFVEYTASRNASLFELVNANDTITTKVATKEGCSKGS